MASYHLDVKSVQRSAGRSATAAAAYRHAERIECHREGRTHDYRAKQGVEASFIVAPEDAPAWAQDRQALWNAAEARDTRVNSVTAREWEVALPHELDPSGRRALAEGFARELVARYGVAADVAIHAPHREGDKRNWHAHVMTTTRRLEPEGLTDKTRALDAQATRGAEVTHMRERWATLQNDALERHGHEARVDHRSLKAQREVALARGDERTAEILDRAPEVKLGPTVSSIERREERAAERDGREYVPRTERGAQVHEARQARTLLAELARVREALREEVRHRADAARETYAHAREEGAGQIRAGLAALRAAAQRQGIGVEHGQGQERSPARGLAHGLAHGPAPGEERGRETERDPWQERQASRASIKERLGHITAREEATRHAQDGPAAGLSAHRSDRQGQEERSLGREAIRERLEALRNRARPLPEREEPVAGLPTHVRDPERAQEAHRARSVEAIREQLRGVLDRAKPVALDREELGHGHEREGQVHKDQAHGDEREGVAKRHRDRGWGHGL